MKSKFYIPKSGFSWIFPNRPAKITKKGKLYFCDYADGSRLNIKKSELERFKLCPRAVIEKEIVYLQGLLQFYTE